MQFPALAARRDIGRFLLVLAVVGLLLAALALAGLRWLHLDALYPWAPAGPWRWPLAAALLLLAALGGWQLRRGWHRHGQAPRPGRMAGRIATRAALVLGGVALCAALAALALVHDTFERGARESLQLVTRSQAVALGQALDVALAQPATLAHRRAVQQALAQLGLQAAQPQALAELQDALAPALAGEVVGIEVFGLDPARPALARAGRDTAWPGEPVLTLRTPGRQGRLGWQQVHMLTTEQEVLAAGHPVGRVRMLLRLPALDQLMHALRSSGQGMDAVLCSREGPDLTVCAPSRFYAEPLRIPMFDALGRPRLPVNHALLGESGVGEAVDLRQVPVLVAHTPVGEHGLALVVKTDAQAAYAPLRRHLLAVLAAFAGLVLLGTLALRVVVQPLVARLAREQRRTRLITDNLPVLIVYLDRDQRLRFVNDTFCRWFGVQRQAALGRPLRQVIGEAFYAQRRAGIERALAGERVVLDLAAELGGERRDLRVEYLPDRDPAGQVLGLYALGSDLTALKQVERELTLLARFDTLTGLPNRHQFNERISEALARSGRTGRALALMFLDVDRFKHINDELGHAAGDQVLQELARRLQAALRGTDFVARLAGDEFVVLIEGLQEAAELDLVARKLLSRVSRQAFELGQRRRVVHISIGVALHREARATPQQLLASADAALYDAKARGRNTFVVLECRAEEAERLAG